MFLPQVDWQPISDVEKFDYLLKLPHKVRDKISNLKPSSDGYKKSWEKVKGVNYEKVQTFYEQLSKNFDALESLGESGMLKGFVLTTLNKLPQVKSDLVRSDDNWEDWGVEYLIKSLQKWLKRNRSEDIPKKHDDKKDRKERNWYTRKRMDGEQK